MQYLRCLGKVVVFTSLLVIWPIAVAGGQEVVEEPLKLDISTELQDNQKVLIDVDELAEILEETNVQIIDARRAEKYRFSHIRNAINIPAMSLVDKGIKIKYWLPSVEVLEEIFSNHGVGKESTVIVYDASGGKLACRIFWILHYLGHKKVRVLDGGLPFWRREKGKVTTKVPIVLRENFKAKLNPTIICDKEYVLAHLDDPNVAIIDCRNDAEYAGKISKAHTNGRIPGTIHIEWKKNLTKLKTFKSPEELRQVYEAEGITKDKEVIFYCDGGIRACHGYFVLKHILCYPSVRVYEGSWAEWGEDVSTPKEKD